MIFPPDLDVIKTAVVNGSLVLPEGCSFEDFHGMVADLMLGESIFRGCLPIKFVRNPTPTPARVMLVTNENRSYLRSGLATFRTVISRDPFILPVRWFEGVVPPKADWLRMCLRAKHSKPDRDSPATPTGEFIVSSFYGSPVQGEIPSSTQQLLVNSLFGGIGGSRDTQNLLEASDFWSKYAEIGPPENLVEEG